MMVIHSWVRERSRQDQYLASKVSAIKARLAALDRNFSDDFWTRIDVQSDDATRYRPRR
jgi:hypothetical protein